MLAIRLFAPTMEVAVDGTPIAMGEQAQLLLAYLAAGGGRPERREAIRELIWHGHSAKAQDEQLRTALKKIRAALGSENSCIKAQPGFLSLDFTQPVTVDAHLLVHAAEDETCALPDLMTAAGLYRGEFVAFVLSTRVGKRHAHRMASDSDDDIEKWWGRTHQKFRNAHDKVLARLFGALYDQELWLESAQWGERWALTGSLSEAEYADVLDAVHKTNDGARFNALLAHARQAWPDSAEIARTLHHLNRSRIAHNLPALPRGVIGREVELARLATQLAGNETRMISISGIGGVGKSTLALAAAQHAKDNLHQRFFDGVFWVRAEGLKTTAECANAIATAVGFHPDLAGRSQPRDQMLNWLRDKRALVVIDDLDVLLSHDQSTNEGLDHLGIRQFLHDVYHQAQQATLLLTSREQLGLDMDMSSMLEGLGIPAVDGAGLAEPYAAVQLFEDEARRQLAGQRSVAAMRGAAHKIARLTEGLPLALQMAAGLLPAHAGDANGVALAIEKNYRILQRQDLNVSARHRSIQAVFEASWQRLSAPEQAALSALSTFAGGFDPAAAAAVAQATPELLQSLFRKALVQLSHAAIANGRFGLHALLRQFCLAKLEANALHAAEVRQRFATHFAGLAGGSADWRTFADDWANMLQALRHAHGSAHWQLVCELANGMSERWYAAGRYTDVREGLALACGAAETLGDTRALVRFLAQRGRACVRQADYAEADGYFAQALALGTRLMDAQSLGLVYYERAQGGIETGGYVLASQCLDDCLDIGHELNDRLLVAEAHRQRARMHYNVGRYADALQSALEAQASYASIDDAACKISFFRLHAEILLRLTQSGAGNHEAGFEACFARAQELCGRFGNLREQAALEFTHAQWLRYHKNFGAARDAAQRSLASFREIGDRKTAAFVIADLGYIEMRSENWAAACEQLEQARAALEQLGDHTNIIAVTFRLGEAYLHLGLQAKAKPALEQALVLAKTYAHPMHDAIAKALAGISHPLP